MITDIQFREAAALLKRSSAPDAWENFIGAFEAYTFTKIGECADADMATVVLAQGFARQCKKFLQMFTECDRVSTPPQRPQHVQGGQQSWHQQQP